LNIYGATDQNTVANDEVTIREIGRPLADFLDRLHFPGWKIGIFSLEGPLRRTAETPLAWFYLVVSGEIEIELAGVTPVLLGRGEAAIIGSGARHALHGRSFPDDGSFAPAKILFGSFATDGSGSQQLETLLPAFARFAPSEPSAPVGGAGFVDWLAAEAESHRPGGVAVASRFLQSAFVEAIRTHLVAELADSASPTKKQLAPLQAALDPCVGTVLRLVHESPERDWTVHSLARESGLSRSAFADRFRTLVGQPPLQYVTEIRMQQATQLLESTDLPVKRIASLVGYESVSAFSSAYKRRFGRPPIAIRSGGSSASNGEC
jgi:AraC-like DNA-binding protein